MNNKSFLFNLTRVALAFALIFQFFQPICAEDNWDEYKEGSIPQEATRAVVGRVFGVQGEAPSIDYHVVEMTRRSPFNASVRSAILPGWGQHFNRQRIKGTLFFLTAVGAAWGAAHQYHESKKSFDEYESRGLKADDLYDDYESQQSQALLLGGLAAVLWGISIFDAYRNAYSPLYSKNVNFDVAWTPDQSTVRVQTKF